MSSFQQSDLLHCRSIANTSFVSTNYVYNIYYQNKYFKYLPSFVRFFQFS
jgi:hypothetical protein